MTANELRIGNYVKTDYTDFIYSVWGIMNKCRILELDSQESDHHISSISMESCRPVLLTEEWLLKFGFQGNDMDMWIVLPLGNGLELHIDCVFEGEFKNACLTQGRFEKGIPGKDYRYAYFSECKYAHTLQNLYFALTNEELKLKQ